MSLRRNPILVVLLTWLIPGAGHYALGRRTQATVFFLTITGTYFFGMWLADFSNVSIERHGYYFLAQVFNGVETLVAMVLTKGYLVDHVPRHLGMDTLGVGILYTAVASLLNIIVMAHAFAVAVGIEEPAKEAGKPAKEEGGA